jgi:ABC-type thiamin/hydroxymethylpyrimidine transport system permease subunit
MFNTREISLIIILSALGGAVSVPIGYAGNLLKSIPILPLGTPQLLSGIHVLWLLLAALLTKKTGAATLTGAVKGLVELSLFSFHGIQVLFISFIEGIVVDLVLRFLGTDSAMKVGVACGLSASSNVLVMWLLVLQGFPLTVIAFMWVLSLASGIVIGYFGEYAAKRAESIYR